MTTRTTDYSKRSFLAKQKLIRLLQDAHAGERAAANAYFGHAQSLFIRSENEKSEILKILEDELHHRRELKVMLLSLGAEPRVVREQLMWMIGAVIGVLSFFGGWFIPMYGAGKLESHNIGEYEEAARLAKLCGEEALIESLLIFAEVEWDHEIYFHQRIKDVWLSKYVRGWPRPKPKESIRTDFMLWCETEMPPLR